MKLNKKIIVKIICIILLIFPGIFLEAQINADSLESALKTADKSGKLSILNTLSNYNLVISPAVAIDYGSQALVIAEELNRITEKITANCNIGTAYLNLGDTKKSLSYYNQALDLAKSASLQKEIAQVSLKIGNYYNISSVYDKALQYDLDAMKIYKTLDDKPGLSDCYHNIGIVYFYLGNFEKALDFSQKALEIREQLKDKVSISKSLNNIAMININMNKTDLALENYFKALKLMEELKSISDQSYALTNIGVAYKKMGNINLALDYFLKSLALYENFTDNRNKSKLLVHIGNSYTELKKFDKAESYLEQGLSLAKKSGYLDMIAFSYRNLADLYLMMGDYKKTLDYKNLYFDIKESVFNDENKKSIAELQVRIENDNTQREAELIKEKSNILYMFFAFLALAVIIIIIILYSRTKAKIKANLTITDMNFSNLEANTSIELLLLWTNYQNGSYTFAPDKINLIDVINTSILNLKQFIDAKKINITASLAPGTIATVDSVTMNLIVRYILLYTIKNCTKGDRITITSTNNGEIVHINFTFYSTKINITEITELFNANIRQLVSNKENELGENLGLALCKEFIVLSSGKIIVETMSDKQNSIKFSLPG